ncbi:MAG: hypothetical protein V4813_10530 [Gemmatimonadota bacterium]
MIQTFILRFTGALNRRRAYAPTHPMVRDAEVALLDAVAAALESRATLSIGVARHELLVDGEPYEARGASELATRLHRCGVGAVTIESGVTAEDLRAALAWLAVEPESAGQTAPPQGTVHITRTAYDHLVLDDAIREAENAVASLWRSLAELAGMRPATTGAADGGHSESETEELDTRSIATALRGVLHQPAVARRTAVAVLELTKLVATTSDDGRTLIGRELESLLDQLGDDAFAPIVRSLHDHSQHQQKFVTQLVEALPLTSAPAWLSAAAVAAERPMSQQLLRLMTKLSSLADDRGEVETEAAFRDATRDLVAGWTLVDPNPEQHVELLDRIASFERGTAAQPRRAGTGAAQQSVVESMRLVQMALELDRGGEDTAAAAEALMAAGSGRALLSWIAAAGETETARWLRSVATSERAVRQVLLTEPVDRLEARALLALLDTTYTETLLDILAEAGTRGTRLIVRQRLAEFGSEITPRLLARLDEAPWYVVRNILTLLHDLAMQQSGTTVGGETMLRLLDHGQVQVRVEAVRLLLLMGESARAAALHRALDDANDRVAMVAIEALADAATTDGTLPSPLLAQLKAQVDNGTRSDTVRARAVRAVAPLQDDVTRDWLIGLVTHRTRFLRRLSLNQPSQTAAAALQVLLRSYPTDPEVRAVRDLAKRDARDPRWMARDPGILTEHVA